MALFNYFLAVAGTIGIGGDADVYTVERFAALNSGKIVVAHAHNLLACIEMSGNN